AFLQNAAHPDDRRVPDDLVLGDLLLARVAAGGAARVGSAVPNLPGAVAYPPAGAPVAFLASYRYREGDGELWLADASAPPRKLGFRVRRRWGGLRARPGPAAGWRPAAHRDRLVRRSPARSRARHFVRGRRDGRRGAPLDGWRAGEAYGNLLRASRGGEP